VPKPDNSTRVGELTNRVTKLREDRRGVDEEIARVSKESSWLDSWAQQFMQSPATNINTTATSAFLQMTSTEALGQLDNFLDYYSKKLQSIDEKNVKLAAQKQGASLTNTDFLFFFCLTPTCWLDLDKQIRSLETELPSLTNVDYVTETRILLEAQEDNTEVRLFIPASTFQLTHPIPSHQFTLQLAYVVTGASWVAAYDIRATGSDTKLALTYYGSISNNTGEDWSDVELSLSTARPSIGGAPPELKTTYVQFYNPYQSAPLGSHSRGLMQNLMVMQAEASPAILNDEEEKNDLAGGGAPAVLTAQAKESSTCTTFAIPRRSTILADNKAHKVTITLTTLDATFTYTAIPQLAPHAYLKASVRNSTKDFPFLAGDMLVFMDNNFVAKSEMKATQPNETFGLYLGTDGSIKVEASPPSHVKDTTGYFSKSNLKVRWIALKTLTFSLMTGALFRP